MPVFSLGPPRPLNVFLPALHGRNFQTRWKSVKVIAYTDDSSSDDIAEVQMQALPGTEQQQDIGTTSNDSMHQSNQQVTLSIERLALSCHTA